MLNNNIVICAYKIFHILKSKQMQFKNGKTETKMNLNRQKSDTLMQSNFMEYDNYIDTLSRHLCTQLRHLFSARSLRADYTSKMVQEHSQLCQSTFKLIRSKSCSFNCTLVCQSTPFGMRESARFLSASQTLFFNF